MDDIRMPAVASMFYPDDRINLKRMLNQYLSSVPESLEDFMHRNRVDRLFGLISPHAGYVYSGPVAACGFSLLKDAKVDTVVLIGPSHFTLFDGFAMSFHKAFRTPLGDVPVDTAFCELLAAEGRGVFDYLNAAHSREHSLEVQIPFLQSVLEDGFKIVPLLMGSQDLDNVMAGAQVLERVLKKNDSSVLFVISSDLSHYHDGRTAAAMDKELIGLIEDMNVTELVRKTESHSLEACGAGPISVFLELSRRTGHSSLRTLLYQHSGQVSGDNARVVGYLSAAVW